MKKIKITSFNQLRAIAAQSANRFAHLDGGMSPALYTGDGDAALSISGRVQNFAQEGHVEKQFSITVVNSGATAIALLLFAGYNAGSSLAANLVKDGAGSGAIADIAGSTGKAGLTISEIQNFVKQNPTRVVGLRIQSTTESQMNNNIEIGRLDIFAEKGKNYLYPSAHINATSFQTKIVTMPTDFQLDDRSTVAVNIQPGTTTFTFFCGATLDNALLLASKAEAAKSTLSVLGQ